jgi:GNAT superfamily N-acetyltransferase
VTLPVIGLEPGARGRGLGRRLMAAFELGAIRLGAAAISLGAGDDVGGFYRRLGYAGRGPMLRKALPCRSRGRSWRRGCGGSRRPPAIPRAGRTGHGDHSPTGG